MKTPEEYIREMLGHCIEGDRLNLNVSTVELLLQTYKNTLISEESYKAAKWDNLKESVSQLYKGNEGNSDVALIIGDLTIDKLGIAK